MDEQHFDSELRNALLNYQDTTSPTIGWSRLNLPTVRISGFKKILWASLIVNGVLILLVPFFYFEIKKLNGRLVEMERRSPAVIGVASAPISMLETDVKLAKSEPQKPTAMTSSLSERNVKEAISAIPPSPPALDPTWTYIPIPSPRSFELGKVEEVSLASIPGIRVARKSPTMPIVPRQKNKLRSMSHSDLVSLEKDRFGNSVKLQYAANLSTSALSTAQFNPGIGLMAGVEANLWLNPIWSISSGVSYGAMWMKSEDSELYEERFLSYNENPVPGLTQMQKRMSVIRLPISLQYHYLLNDRTMIHAGVGASFLIQQGLKCAFTQKIKESHGGSEPYEEEFHTIKMEFYDRRWHYLNTSLHYELGLSRAFKNNRNSWGLGLFYDIPISTALVDGSISQLGLNTRLIFGTNN